MMALNVEEGTLKPTCMPDGTTILPIFALPVTLTIHEPDRLEISITGPRGAVPVDTLLCFRGHLDKPDRGFTWNRYRTFSAHYDANFDEVTEPLRQLGFAAEEANKLRPITKGAEYEEFYDPQYMRAHSRIVGSGRTPAQLVLFTGDGDKVRVLDRFYPSRNADADGDEFEWDRSRIGAHWWTEENGGVLENYTAIVERAKAKRVLEVVGFDPDVVDDVFPPGQIRHYKAGFLARAACRLNGHVQYGRFGHALSGKDFICDRCRRRLIYNGYMVYKTDCDRFERMEMGRGYRYVSVLRIKICRLRKHKVFRSCDTELSPGVLDTYCNTCHVMVSGLY